MYFVYIIRCADSSLYTGTAADWKKRLRQHAQRGPQCARYTRARPITALEALWQVADKSAALRLEYRLKRLTAAQKRELLRAPERWAAFVPALAGLACVALPEATLEQALSPAPDPSAAAARR